MTSVSQGPVMECCSPAIPPQVLPAGHHPFCSHAGAMAEWHVTGWEVGRASEVKVQGTMVKELKKIDAVAFHLCLLRILQAGWKLSPFTALPPPAYPPNQAHPPPYQMERGMPCLYLDITQETVLSQMLLSVSVRFNQTENKPLLYYKVILAKESNKIIYKLLYSHPNDMHTRELFRVIMSQCENCAILSYMV